MADEPREPLRDDPLLQEAAELAAILDGPDPASALPMSDARRRALARRLAAGPSVARAPTRASGAGSRAALLVAAAIAAAVCLIWVLRAPPAAPGSLPAYHLEVGGAAHALGDGARERVSVRRGEPLVVVLTPEHATAPAPIEMHLRRQGARVALAPLVEPGRGGVIVVRGIVGESLALDVGDNTVELTVGTCAGDRSDAACRRFEFEVEVRP